MNYLPLFFVLAGLLTLISYPSYSEETSNYSIMGNGFSIINEQIIPVSFDALFQSSNNEQIKFQSGDIFLGNTKHQIKEIRLSLPQNKKSLELIANFDGFVLHASGKLVMSTNEGLIYDLRGQISQQEVKKSASFLVLLKQTVIQNPTPVQKQDVLLLVKHHNKVEWKDDYKFTIRTFNPQLNQESDFYRTSGFLNDVNISAKIINPIGEVIKTSSGKTNESGYYEDSILIPDNARPGLYTLSVTASGKNYAVVTKELNFVVTSQ